MPKRVRDYEKDLIEKLKDMEFAAEHLNVPLEDSADERFLITLRQTTKAHRMTAVAERPRITRQTMYRALSENPELSSFRTLLAARGLRLAVKQKQQAS